ncbi:MAG TPA: hypothetical protein VJI75_04005 [Candidatus Nanoarchaeia archaeon]|nr:hypothetical protein [Candidatus Nanoarchaeia archaeon]
MNERPLFIKIDQYDDIKDTVKLIRAKIGEARTILDKIGQLRHEEEAELEIWRQELDDVDKKVGFINETLSPSE